MINIEIIYIPPKGLLFQKEIEVPEKCSIDSALAISGLYQVFPETKNFPVGIFSNLVARDRLVQAGDRIEVYRPLLVSPEENRQTRIKAARVRK